MMNKVNACLFIVFMLAFPYGLQAQEWPTFLLEDFQVNENVGSCPQDQSAIAPLANGGFVVVWRDYRNGNADIYAQKFNKDGSRNGGNVKVDRAAAGINCSNPDVAGDPNGGYTVIWEEPGGSAYNIMCRRFDQYGSPTSAPFALKVDSKASGEKLPVIASDRAGGFIVAWQDKRNDNGDIYCQRYDSTSAPIRDNFAVNDDNVGEGTQSFPAIASDARGGFIIVWQDNRAGYQHRTFAQRYDRNGRTIGFNFCVDDDLSGPEQWSPDVSFAPSGDFVIVWKNGSQDDLDIWGRRYAADNSALGDYFFVTNDSSASRQFNPTVAHDETGAFIVAWQDDRNGQNEIFARFYDADGLPTGEAQRLDDNRSPAHHFSPATAAVQAGEFVASWDDRRAGLGDIFAQRVKTDSSDVGTNFRINDDSGSSYQEFPAVVRNRRGEIFVAWTDYRHGGQDVYAQKIDSLGAISGGNIRISKRHGALIPTTPALAAGPNSIACVWNRSIDESTKVVMQSWDFNGALIDSNATLPGFNPSAQQINPQLAYFLDGSFVVVWSENKGDLSGGEWEIYAQRFAADRTPIDAPILVNFDNRNDRQDFPAVAASADGGFIVVYIDFSDSPGGLMCQRFDAAARPSGTNFKVDTGSFAADKRLASAVFDSHGGFIIVWSGSSKTSQGIYFKQYSDQGVPFRGVTTVDSIFANAPAELKNPRIAIDYDDSFVIAWQMSDKSKAYSNIFAAYYNGNGESFFPKFKVHKPIASYASQPTIALYDGRLFSAWSDDRIPGQGFDIRASLVELRPATPVENESLQPCRFMLHRNWPNPFNPSTTIRFDLPRQAKVSLEIDDLLGRRVRVLVDERMEAGAHLFSWDGRADNGIEAAAGIYFARLRAGEQTQTIKMLLVR